MFFQCCCAQDTPESPNGEVLFGAFEATDPEPQLTEVAPRPKWQPKNEKNLQQFEVVLERNRKQDIGVTFVAKQNLQFLPVIEEVRGGGLIDEWNERNGKRVQPSTYIIAANGKINPDEILDECETATQLILWMERKTQYTISMRQKKKVLGLDLDGNVVVQLTRPSSDTPGSLIGLYAWNQTCESGCEVRPGDTILSANGEATASRILPTIKETSADSSLTLVMGRGSSAS